MSRSRRWFLGLAAAACVVAAGAGFLAWRTLDRAVTRAASPEAVASRRVRPLAFAALARNGARGERATLVLGDGTIASAFAAGGAVYTAGGSGLTDGETVWDVRAGLPSLRLSSGASWRDVPVFALERGGWGRLGPAGLEQASSGWGRLEVRAFLEVPGGELLVGARQGLFRAASASPELERLSGEPVRALALAPGGEIVAGGENGLLVVTASGVARRVATPDPWVDAVGVDAERRILWAATPLGIALGALDADALALHARGGDGTAGVFANGRWHHLPVDGGTRVAVLGADGTRVERPAPETLRRLYVLDGQLHADGPSGLWRLGDARWVLARKRAPSLPAAHVNALAADGSTLWAGFFDGGVARADAAGLRFTLVDGNAWGVNALLSAGGALYAATLQGAFRVEGSRATELPGAGAAFALAATPAGVAVGYGQGVFFPERRLLSAFHGLPGNQAYALAALPAKDSLWVGTPSGLGRIDRRRVALRVTAGEGKLPHPWVTALVAKDDALYVGTYGGGVTCRTGEGAREQWQRFPETEGLKVNAGAMVMDADGRLWIGTQGKGLFRTDRARTRFEPVEVPLPSPDVFALALFPSNAPRSLFVGTNEGLAKVPLERGEAGERANATNAFLTPGIAVMSTPVSSTEVVR